MNRHSFLKSCGETALALALGLIPSAAWAGPDAGAIEVAVEPGLAAPALSLPADAAPAAAGADTRPSGLVESVSPPLVDAGFTNVPCGFDAGAPAPGCGSVDSPAAPGGTGWDLARLRPPTDVALLPDDEQRYRLAAADCLENCTRGAGEVRDWADHVPSEYAARPGFWKQVGTVKTESLLFLGYFSILSGKKLFKETVPFHFHDEGWFGKDTADIGMDKLTHAFDTYLLAEFLHNQIHRRSNASQGDALTAAVLASGLMIFNEFSDGIEPDSGWSFQDVAMNIAGASFSVLRNTVPGLRDKLAFKIEVVPNEHVYSYSGKPHYQQQRFMFSIKGAGFKPLARTPLRFVDLQVGYYASDFLNSDREAGIEPKRHLFVGIGLNVGELLFGNARSGFGKVGYRVLDYLQLPYTSLRYDTTGHLGY